MRLFYGYKYCTIYSTEKKGKLKNNYEHWADVTLEGIKQRLRDSDKLYE